KRKPEHFDLRLFRTPTTNPPTSPLNGTFTMKFMKVGRVAIITRGRYAGKKVVIVQPSDTGSKAHPFPFAIVAGIERYPQKVTRRMGKKLVDRRSKVKPFIKVINYNHLMPTRYTLELEGLKGVVSAETFKEVSQREDAKKTVKKALEDRYTSGKNRWFFTPLRMFYQRLSSPTFC
ncbi:60S ribosomal protein L27-A, partial [Penicillium lividum]